MERIKTHYLELQGLIVAGWMWAGNVKNEPNYCWVERPRAN